MFDWVQNMSLNIGKRSFKQLLTLSSPIFPFDSLENSTFVSHVLRLTL